MGRLARVGKAPVILSARKIDPVRAELRFNMSHCQRKGPPAFRSGQVIPITAHPRYQRAR